MLRNKMADVNVWMHESFFTDLHAFKCNRFLDGNKKVIIDCETGSNSWISKSTFILSSSMFSKSCLFTL